MKLFLQTMFICFFVFLVIAVIALGKLCTDLNKTISNKDQNIAKLDSLQKLTEKISTNKDTIIKLDKQIIDQCQADMKISAGNISKNKNPAGFLFGNKSISVEELLKITNNALKENIALKNDSNLKAFKLKVIKEKFGISYKDTSDRIVLDNNPKSLLAKTEDLNNQLQKTTSELEVNKQILALLKDRYHINYTVTANQIIIPYQRLDSVNDIYPLVKNKIKIKDGHIWLK